MIFKNKSNGISLISLIKLTDDLQEDLQADISDISSVSMLCCTLRLLTALIEIMSLKAVGVLS